MGAGAQLSERLVSTFLVELEEHARAMERDVMALERAEGAPAQIYTSLFRSAHSLKGAARVIGLDAIETACHRFEEIVEALRDGRLSADAGLCQLLLSAADALAYLQRNAGKQFNGEMVQCWICTMTQKR